MIKIGSTYSTLKSDRIFLDSNMSNERPSRIAPYEIKNLSEMVGCRAINHNDIGIVAPE